MDKVNRDTEAAGGAAAGQRLATTGIEGLDHIFGGGLPRDRVYLVGGPPGAGKTTLALNFLLAGVAQGEPAMLACLSETEAELHEIAASHGWSLRGIHVLDLTREGAEDPARAPTFFPPSEVELGELVGTVLETAERVRPSRVVIDSLSELRLMAEDPLRYRRQILGLKRVLARLDCTVVLLDSEVADPFSEGNVDSLMQGVIRLEQVMPDYGRTRRRLRVTKLRGRDFAGGHHDFDIVRGGLVVYPSHVAAASGTQPSIEPVSTGIEGLDPLLGGGFDRGCSVALVGPPGSGKSSVAMGFVSRMANAGERAAVFLFEETPAVTLARLDGMGLGDALIPHVESGRVDLVKVEPAEMSPGQFGYTLRRLINDGVRTVVVDSLNGYLQAMPDERFLLLNLHDLLSYAGQRGAITVLAMGETGGHAGAPIDLAYLADTVVHLDRGETGDRPWRSLSVVKRRAGRHAHGGRELMIGPPHGVRVGAPIGPSTSAGDRSE